jgi:hypothetical protein
MGGAKQAYQEQIEAEERNLLFQDLIDGGYLDPLEDEEEEEGKELILVQLARKVITSGTSSLSPEEFQLFLKHLDVFWSCQTCERISSGTKCLRCEQDNDEALEELRRRVSTGKVYFFRSGEHLKIGTTKNDIPKRLAQLQTGNPLPIKELGSIPGTYLTENILHQLLKPFRGLGEWFKVEPYVLDLIQILLDPDAAPQLNKTKK